LIDVKSAILWVKENIQSFGGNQKRIALVGSSLGAHLATLAIRTPNFPEFQPGFESKDTQVQSCVTISGLYQFSYRHHLNLQFHLKSDSLGENEDFDFYKTINDRLAKPADLPPQLIIQYFWIT
jgi:acetyl esterase/lipase